MKILKSILLLCFPLWILSCVKDEGNYDYTPINTITIDSIEKTYNCIQGVDTLRIYPELSSSMKESEEAYEYSWYICQNNHKHTVLGTELNLEYKVELQAGSYPLYLEINDKSTGIKWQAYTNLTVSSFLTRGFLLWGEDKEGYARLDMLTMAPEQDTLLAENVFDNSEMQLRNPTGLIFTGDNPLQPVQKHLFLMTEDRDIMTTSGSYFDYLHDFKDADIIETDFEHKEPIRIRDFFPKENAHYPAMRTRSDKGYITDDMILVGNTTQMEFMTTPVNRYAADSKELFKPYPLAFVRGFDYNRFKLNPIFYDMDNDCFVVMNNSYQLAKYCKKLTDRPGDPFPWDNKKVGRKIVYGDNGAENYTGFSHVIMKDEEGKYYIYVFQNPDNNYNPPAKIGAGEVDLSMAVGFTEASHYMFASSRLAVVYSVGSVLHAYDFQRQQHFSMDMGEEITCLEASYDDESDLPLPAFWVATYDESTGTGHLKKMEIPGGSNAVELKERPHEIWPLTMKVIDIQWKNANDNALEQKE